MVFNALELWAPSVRLGRPDGSALFCVDLDCEQGPRYERMMSEPTEPRCLHTEDLVWELEAFAKDLEGSCRCPSSSRPSWSPTWQTPGARCVQRAFRRAPATSVMKVCVGIRAAHYFSERRGGFCRPAGSDRSPRSTRRSIRFVESDAVNVSSTSPSEIKDVWDDAFDLRVTHSGESEHRQPGTGAVVGKRRKGEPVRDHPGSYHFYDTTSIDTSPGGYRIRWNEPLPANVQTGELVAVRDENDPRWCIAVVRWIRQDGEGTSMGVELLSPRAIPVAARVINKKGGPD